MLINIALVYTPYGKYLFNHIPIAVYFDNRNYEVVEIVKLLFCSILNEDLIGGDYLGNHYGHVFDILTAYVVNTTGSFTY